MSASSRAICRAFETDLSLIFKRREISGIDDPIAVISSTLRITSRLTTVGLPTRTPRALAAAMPAFVLSTMSPPLVFRHDRQDTEHGAPLIGGGVDMVSDRN